MPVYVIFNHPFKPWAISYNVSTKEELQDQWRKTMGKIGTIFRGISYEIKEVA
jgi:hypothetical protein